MQSTLLTSFPSETLLHIFSFLNAEELSNAATSCRKLRRIATSDELWRPIIQACLEKSPPLRSPNISPLTNPLPPWDPSFGLISTDRNSANRERWFAVPPGTESEQEKVDLNSSTNRISHLLFPGSESLFEVYWKFIHHLHKLLGWWIGDLPSYGVIIRIVYDPKYRNSIDNDQESTAAFICEKLHLVNRLQGMGSSGLRSPWLEATSFDIKGLRGNPSSDGTTIETARMSIDVSVPGVKTEKLWVATWNDIRQLKAPNMTSGTDVAKITWQGGRVLAKDGGQTREDASARDSQASIISRARALAAQMVFGHSIHESEVENSGDRSMELDEDEDDTLQDVTDQEDDVYGNRLSLSTIMAASAVDTFENGDFDHIPYPLRTIQQRSGNQVHTVFLSSGAIYTAPATDRSRRGKEKKQSANRLSVRCEKYKPYENADTDRNRAFGLYLSEHLPLPPIDFPPPALLPLVRDLAGVDFLPTSQVASNSSSSAFERFLDQGTAFELNVLRMEPCPPYRPWPHLSQPKPSGIRFAPIQCPPLRPVKPTATRSEQGEEVSYVHTATVPRHLDPGSFDFNWDCLQGLYGMTYGPWGLELIYIRSRILTVHDFNPDGITLKEGQSLPRSTGPHGPGHALTPDGRSLEETLHWRAEPYVDVADLQMNSQETEFIKPGCRIIEGVKCSGDANVVRGAISFRAFSRGQNQDACLPYYSPGSQWSNFPPWDGRGVRQSQRDTGRIIDSHHHQQQTPGRILDCATGRLAMEGFVNAGCWKRCSVKITSADEIHVYWEALRKVAVCKRLTAC